MAQQERTLDNTNIKLYTTASPNGFKASITLAELNIPYTVVPMDVMNKKEQQEPWYEEINPNKKIPALKDGELCIWESGAILLYLADKYDTEGKISFKRGVGADEEVKYWEMISWVMWHVSEQLPPHSLALHFACFAPVRSDHALEKTLNETKRAYDILDKHLSTRTYLVGEKYTIADIAAFTMAHVHMANVELDVAQWPNVLAWKERIEAREAVKEGLKVPEIPYSKEQLAAWFRGLRETVKAKENADLK